MPSNYLQELDDDGPAGGAPAAAAAHEPPTPVAASSHEPEEKGATATALYDYEAGEDNELSFPENAVITNLVSFALESTVDTVRLTRCTEFPRRRLVAW